MLVIDLEAGKWRTIDARQMSPRRRIEDHEVAAYRNRAKGWAGNIGLAGRMASAFMGSMASQHAHPDGVLEWPGREGFF